LTLILAAAHQPGWLGQAIDLSVEWLLANAQGLFDLIKVSVLALVSVTEMVLEWPPAWMFALITAALGFWRVNGGFALFVLLGFNLVLPNSRLYKL